MLPEHDGGPAGADKAVELRPQVSGIRGSSLLSGGTKRLTRNAPGPQGSARRDAGERERLRKSANSCKEMALNIPVEIAGSDLNDTPFINVSIGDRALVDKFAEPSRRLRVELVVVVHAGSARNTRCS